MSAKKRQLRDVQEFPVLDWRSTINEECLTRLAADDASKALLEELAESLDIDSANNFVDALVAPVSTAYNTFGPLNAAPANLPVWVASGTLPRSANDWVAGLERHFTTDGDFSTEGGDGNSSVWFGDCTLCNPGINMPACEEWLKTLPVSQHSAHLSRVMASTMFNMLDIMMHETCALHVQAVETEKLAKEQAQAAAREQSKLAGAGGGAAAVELPLFNAAPSLATKADLEAMEARMLKQFALIATLVAQSADEAAHRAAK